jgi:NADH:ubiquinone reductase (H+-translocating)
MIQLKNKNKKGTTQQISPTSKKLRIIILGSGFAAIETLKKLQKKYKNNNKNNNVEIIIISKDNFFLFTPMLPEVFSGMIEPRHIVTPVRDFCKNKTEFYHGTVIGIDLENQTVTVRYSIGKYSHPLYHQEKNFSFDYLVIALGSKTNYFGNTNIEKRSFAMKTINDAFVLRNHIINILEQTVIEYDNLELRKRLLSFVVVGGGFSGIETVGELNYFVKNSIKNYYKSINPNEVKVILVSADEHILNEVDEDLGKYTKNILEKKGIEFKMNRMANEANLDNLVLGDGEEIFTHTIIWTAGVTPNDVIKNLDCEHDRKGMLKVKDNLELEGYSKIYSVGDCASIIEPNNNDGKPYPPTAQNAIKQGQLVAKNIIRDIEHKAPKKIKYKVKGSMAKIDKRSGVAKISRFKFKGFLAWWLWRTFYLSKLPTLKKKIRVLSDWSVESLFKNDVSMIKGYTEEKSDDNIASRENNNNNNNNKNKNKRHPLHNSNTTTATTK